MQNSQLEQCPYLKEKKINYNQCPKNEVEKNQIKEISYAYVVRSLMYSPTCTHFNISFAIGMFKRFQSNRE